MADSLLLHGDTQIDAAGGDGRPSAFDRLAQFRVLYLAIFAFMVLYTMSIEVAEAVLDHHFRQSVREATRVSSADCPIVS